MAVICPADPAHEAFEVQGVRPVEIRIRLKILKHSEQRERGITKRHVAEEIKALLPRARCRENSLNDSSEIRVGIRLDDGSPANGVGGAGAREQVTDTKGIRSKIVF